MLFFYKAEQNTLTPLIPLSLKGEGEDIKKEGLTPLSNTPVKASGQ